MQLEIIALGSIFLITTFINLTQKQITKLIKYYPFPQKNNKWENATI